MKAMIVIPARYASSRFPGKPLYKIAGQTMLQRVYGIACAACEDVPDAGIVVATEDERVQAHAAEIGARVVMTPSTCLSGSDRALAACQQLSELPEIVINLQGDAPLTPPSFVKAVLMTLLEEPNVEVATPVVQLTWGELDDLRESKRSRPLSGTTVVVGSDQHALWFSKTILPVIRKEAELRERDEYSPVLRHIGLYGFRLSALKTFVGLPEGRYEALEGLEQLRLLENGIKIRTVKVDYDGGPGMSGVDTLEDAKKAEALLLRVAQALRTKH